MAELVRAVGFAFAVELLSAWPANAAPLTDREQDQAAAAVFDYALTQRTYFSDNAESFDLYLSVRDKDPSPEFLGAIHVSRDKFRPQSAQSRTPQSETRRAMPIAITNFVERSPGIFEGRIGTICGPRCGSIGSAFVTKENEIWRVTSFNPGTAF